MASYNSYKMLKESVDKEITIIGKISEIPWQHLVGSFKDYPYSEYFDLEDGFQIIIYSKTKITAKGTIKVKGKTVEVIGRSKRPREEEEKYVEYHLLVESIIS